MKAVTRTVVAAWLVLVVFTPLCGQQASDAEVAAYEHYREWVNRQPDELFEQGDDAVWRAYRAYLAGDGVDARDIEVRIALVETGGRRLEVARWNRILTADTPTFNTEPNDFLVRMASSLQPGRALDVGMGQGRNAIWLAQQGWDVTGFDPADEAVALAQRLAERAGVSITAEVVGSEGFDWGTEQWDLVVMSYVGTRAWVDTIRRALRPGGHVVVAAFHVDATATASIGGGVVYETNELLELFAGFRILTYEDALGVGDFGRASTRLVHLLARKE